MSRQKKSRREKVLRKRLQHKDMRAQRIRWKLETLYRIVKYGEDPETRAWAETLFRKLSGCRDRYEEEIAEIYTELEGIDR